MVVFLEKFVEDGAHQEELATQLAETFNVYTNVTHLQRGMFRISHYEEMLQRFSPLERLHWAFRPDQYRDNRYLIVGSIPDGGSISYLVNEHGFRRMD